jgi:hypothetical protein
MNIDIKEDLLDLLEEFELATESGDFNLWYFYEWLKNKSDRD